MGMGWHLSKHVKTDSLGSEHKRYGGWIINPLKIHQNTASYCGILYFVYFSKTSTQRSWMAGGSFILCQVRRREQTWTGGKERNHCKASWDLLNMCAVQAVQLAWKSRHDISLCLFWRLVYQMSCILDTIWNVCNVGRVSCIQEVRFVSGRSLLVPSIGFVVVLAPQITILLILRCIRRFPA